MKLAAVIVSRKDSVRIQYKSRKKINGQSLVERKISQLKKYAEKMIVFLGKKRLKK